MTKKPSPRNKEWEKDRRDRLNKTFAELAKLLPHYRNAPPAGAAAPSKIEILQNSIQLILELFDKLKALDPSAAILTGGDENTPWSNGSTTRRMSKREQEAQKPKRKYKKREKKPVEQVPQQSPDAPRPMTPQPSPSPLRLPESSQVAQVLVADEEPRTKENPAPKRVPVSVLRRDGRRSRVVVQRRWYTRIKRHVLEMHRKQKIKLRRKRINFKAPRRAAVPPAGDDKAILGGGEGDKSNKAFEEIPDLLQNPISTNDQQLSELFVSLPQGPSQSGSLSPTEAFLMNFPVVSATLVSAGKGVEQLPVHNNNNQSQAPVSTPILEDYCGDGGGAKQNPKPTEPFSNQHQNMSTDSLPPPPQSASSPCHNTLQKSFEGSSLLFPTCNLPLLDSTFELATIEKQPPFTFSLTTTSTTHQSPSKHRRNHHPQTVPPFAETSDCGPLLNANAADTRITWSHAKKPAAVQEMPAPMLMMADYATTATTAEPFTFSLTKTSDTCSRAGGGTLLTTTGHHNTQPHSNAVAAGNANFEGFSGGPPVPPPPHFNSFSNPLLAPLPPTDCQYGTNSFSFQLTTSTSSIPQPTYTNSSFPAYIGQSVPLPPPPPPSGCTKRPAKAVEHHHHRREKNSARKGTSYANGAAAATAIAAPVEKKKGGPMAVNNSKSHVNWMTESTTMRNYAADELAPGNSYHLSSALMPVGGTSGVHRSSVFRGDEITQKSDIFFAHPPGEERYLWTQPPASSSSCGALDTQRSVTRMTDFNVPQLLPPPPPPQPYGGGSGQGEMPMFFSQEEQPQQQKTASSRPCNRDAEDHQQQQQQQQQQQTQYQPNGNYFSVSNLVGGTSTNKKSGRPQDTNQQQQQQQSLQDCSSSQKWKNHSMWDHSQQLVPKSKPQSYTAEALIGYSGQPQPQQPQPAKKQNVFSIQEVAGGDPSEGVEGMDFNYNPLNAAPQFGQSRADGLKMNGQHQDAANSFAFFANDFMQPPLFPAPALSLLSEHNVCGSKGVNKSGTSKAATGGAQSRKMEFEEAGGGGLLMSNDQPATAASNHQSNYEFSSSTSYFSSSSISQGHPPPPPPPFLINPDSFGYADNCKLPQFGVSSVPPPALDFNVTPAGPSSNFSSNYLPNFNMSSICPEINNPIH